MSDLTDLFAELPEDLQAGVRELGWRKPMPVQTKTIPLMREGHDLIVQARTGSGKTGAFGIAIIESIDTELAVTQALVMLPTRELANQVAHELATLGRPSGVRCLAIYGGVGYGPQIEGLQQGAHVVVGTPGRILDHLGARRLALDRVRIVVFDEADEMLSLGFWPDMREIRSYLPEDRRSHLFSATIPEKVRSLSRFFLTDAHFVSLSEGQIAPQEIEHYFYVCTAQEKESVLARIIEYEDPESAIVFCNTKADVRYVTGYLQKRGFDADQISGDLTQAAREQAIGKIKNGSLRFLIATDVAARGIDISDLSHVISYAAPESPEVYVHRTGRTGRVGKSGVALSLISGLDIGNFRHLQNVNRIEITERPIPSEEEMLGRIRERLAVKVEQEMRSLPEANRRDRVDRLVPVVETLVATSEGKRDLAAICAAYLQEHRPETTIREEEAGQPEARPPAAHASPEPARRSGPAADSGPKRNRKRRPRRREPGRSG
ncbi:MAG: DEAD/DEAH box helicase [Myxococcota bacterium]